MNWLLIIRLLGIIVTSMLIGIQLKMKKFSLDFCLNIAIVCVWVYLILLS